MEDDPLDLLGEPAPSTGGAEDAGYPIDSVDRALAETANRHEKVAVTHRIDVLAVYPSSLFAGSQVTALQNFVYLGESLANDILANSKVGVTPSPDRPPVTVATAR